MQTNLLWTGREYYSLENCLVNTTDIGSEIESTIIGRYDEQIYKVEYKIITNEYWETSRVDIQWRHTNQREQVVFFESDTKGNWTMNGQPAHKFKGCIDVDIPLTPFTNTLPINRLKLKQDQEHQIQVIYLDLLAQQIMPVRQKYIRLSDKEYHYENVPNDFEAKIEVDESGFVVDYPSLFVRTAKLMSDYV